MSRGVGRIQRHMEYIANTIEAMLDLLEIIQNLPAAAVRGSKIRFEVEHEHEREE